MSENILKINIICSDNGWIYAKFISMFRKFSKHQIFVNSSEVCDIAHCLPYYELSENIKRPCSVWLSHQEQKKILHEKFIYAAKNSDLSISQSKKYMDIAIGYGAKNIIQIVPGVDLIKFSLRSTERQSSKNKLIVGYVGRQYVSSDRKNPQLLKKIGSLPFIDLKISGGLIKEYDLPKFYSHCDIIISPSFIEGGAMCIIEGLAVGVPILCFGDVGMANEFEKGVLKAKYGDDDAFIKQLKEFWDIKKHLEYRKIEVMQSLRKQVEGFSWENFVIKHDEAWLKLKNEKI